MSKRTALFATALVLAVNSLTVIVPFVSPAQVSALGGTVVNTEAELRSALTGSDSVISLGDNITTTSQLSVTRPLTIDGNNKTLTAGFTGSSNNDTVLMASKPVTVSSLTVDGAGKTGVQGVQIYRTTATLNNVVVKNNKKAGLNVNGSDVTVLNISTANNGGSFGGIHISKGSGVAETPKLTVNGRSTHTSESLQIYKDPSNGNNGTVVDVNEQYTSTNFFGYVTYKLKAAPAAPTNLRYNGAEACGFTTSTNWVTPTWNAVSGADSYNYKATLPNGSVYGPTNVGSVTSLSGTFGAAGTSTFSVQAVSKSGLTSDWAPACAATYAPKPATPNLVTPGNGAAINYDQFWFDWDDAEGAQSYEIQTSQSDATNPDGSLSTGVWAGDSNHNQPTESRAWSAGASGTWYWQVRSVSAQGVKSDWSTVWSITIDKTAPVQPTDLTWTTAGGAVVANGGVTNEENGNVSWTPSASTDVDHYLYRSWTGIEGNTYTEANPYEAQANGTTLAGAFNQGEGTYYFSVAAVDRAGNISEWSAPYAINYDKTAPEVQITTRTATLIRGTGEAGTSVIVRIDGVDKTPVIVGNDGTWQYTIAPALSVGTHIISARASDAAGNTGTSQAYTVTVFAITPVGPTVPAAGGEGENQNSTPGVNVVSVAVPASIGPSALSQVLGDSTQNTDGSGSNGEVKGAETVAQSAKTSDENMGKALGLAWYWWLLIIAGALLVIWWIVAAVRRRNAEA